MNATGNRGPGRCSPRSWPRRLWRPRRAEQEPHGRRAARVAAHRRGTGRHAELAGRDEPDLDQERLRAAGPGHDRRGAHRLPGRGAPDAAATPARPGGSPLRLASVSITVPCHRGAAATFVAYGDTDVFTLGQSMQPVACVPAGRRRLEARRDRE